MRVAEVDQDVLRFLWFNNVHEKIPDIQIFKFTRVVFGVSPSPYPLNATIAQHLKQFESMHTNTVQKIRNSIYVDDVVAGASDVHEAFEFFKESKDIFSKGGFNLRKFDSNCKELQHMIDLVEYGMSKK